jgi:hypothetical protein
VTGKLTRAAPSSLIEVARTSDFSSCLEWDWSLFCTYASGDLPNLKLIKLELPQCRIPIDHLFLETRSLNTWRFQHWWNQCYGTGKSLCFLKRPPQLRTFVHFSGTEHAGQLGSNRSRYSQGRVHKEILSGWFRYATGVQRRVQYTRTIFLSR